MPSVFLLISYASRPAPHVVGEPRAAALVDQLVRAGDDLRLALLGQLGIEHEQNLVFVHGSLVLLPSV